MNIIVAICKKNNGIGFKNHIPWNLKKELKYFKSITTKGKKNVVIMGRNTWESLPIKPLPDRVNVVITSSDNIDNSEAIVFKTLDQAYESYKDYDNINVIGGERLYQEALNHNNLDFVFVTEIYKEFECDKFFPKLDPKLNLINISNFYEENNIFYRQKVYNYKFSELQNLEEINYLNLLRKIIKNGERVQSRNAITYRIFSNVLTYDLRDTFPILTTKRVYWKGILEEMLWFISGSTNANKLSDKKVKIWEPNSSREFLDLRGLQHYDVGDIGPTYGFNFRNFGAEYKGMNHKYQGFDQIKYLINEIKTNPTSRRLIIDLWNPCDFDKTALPPCVFMYQFFVSQGKLSCQLYQRSADSFPANHWNTTSCSLFIHMIAHVCGLQPDKLIHITGDTHIYEEHLEQVKEQLERKPKPFPKLNIKRKVENIEDFKAEDFELIDYTPEKTIKAGIVA
jgi:dihydrofolate reductase / thymidylate synthase